MNCGVHVGARHVVAREVGFQAAPVGVPPPEGSSGDGMLTTRAFLVAVGGLLPGGTLYSVDFPLPLSEIQNGLPFTSGGPTTVVDSVRPHAFRRSGSKICAECLMPFASISVLATGSHFGGFWLMGSLGS